jgi:hypothetical protein
MEERIKQLMKSLDLTREEAIELIQEDEQVDRMTTKQAESDLTPDQKKAIKKARLGAKAVNAYGKTVVRERKENKLKQSLIAEIFKFLTENSAHSIKNCEILNKDRQISFETGGETFELTLVQKRKPKNKGFF